MWKFVEHCPCLEEKIVLVVKNRPANAGDIRKAGSNLGFGRSLEEGMATHFSILAHGQNPMDRGAWWTTSIGSQRVRYNGSDLAHTRTHTVLVHLLNSVGMCVCVCVCERERSFS